MPATVWRSPGSVAVGSDEVSNAWGASGQIPLTVAGIAAVDGSAPGCFCNSSSIGQFGAAYNFGFVPSDIPAGATNIAPEIRFLQCDSSLSARGIRFEAIHVNRNAATNEQTSLNLAPLEEFRAGQPLDVVVGGNATVWGLTFTAADVTSPNFTTNFRLIRDRAGAVSGRVDAVGMRWHYTEGGDTTPPAPPTGLSAIII